MTRIKNAPLLGAHLSISAGLEDAIIKGEELGCTAIQIFTQSNRQWIARPLSEHQIERFKKTHERSSVEIVVAHASYLLNLGSPDAHVRTKSTDALGLELQRCDLLGIPYLVVHVGSRLSSSVARFTDQLAEQLTIVLENISGPSIILLENMAGQGSSVGSTFEELAAIRELVPLKNRIGFCFDTCHAFAAGYNFDTKQDYHDLWSRFDDILGLENLKAIHINDSKKARGSRVDRHEHIGQGLIGIEAFRLLMNDTKLQEIPKILETPKEDGLENDKRNLATLRGLIDSLSKQ
jgi:deoxyribonuclease-4